LGEKEADLVEWHDFVYSLQSSKQYKR